jgi:allantoicase
LAGNTRNVFEISTVDFRFTHIRLRIHPDGGVARLRVRGEPVPDPRWLAVVPFDLAARVNGGAIERCSDGFFSPPENMLQPGASRVMGDGWETARRRAGGHDWAIVRLAAPAIPRVLEIDTTHYKGNAPDRVSVAGLDARRAEPSANAGWRPVLPETPLRPDTAHRFRVAPAEPVTHLRLDVFPDGGVARFRVYGPITGLGVAALRAAWRASLPPAHARQLTDPA